MKSILKNSLWLGCVCLSLSVSANVSFNSHAAPLSRLLPELSKVAGIRLEASVRMQNTVMAIQVKNVDLDQLLKKIAEASDGEWEKTANGYSLNLSLDKDRDQRRELLQGKVSRLKAYVDQQRAQWEKQTDNSYAYASLACIDTLDDIGLQNLVSIAPGTAVVLRADSKRPEARLSPKAIRIAQQLATNPTFRASAPAAKPETITLVITKPGFGENLSVTYNMELDQPYTTTGAMLMYQVTPQKQEEAIALTKPQAVFKPEEGSIQFAKELVATMGGVGGQAYISYSGMAQTPAVLSWTSRLKASEMNSLRTARERALNCDVKEPLHTALGEGLEWLSKSEEANLVAVLPDSALVPACLTVSKDQIAATELAKQAINAWGLAIKHADNWMVVMPAKPSESRDHRLDRNRLAKTLKTIKQKQTLPVEDQKAYFVNQPEGSPTDTFEYAYFMLIHPYWANIMATSCYDQSRAIMRFYHSLSPSQKKTDFEHRLKLTDLTETQREFVYRLLSSKLNGNLMIKMSQPIETNEQAHAFLYGASEEIKFLKGENDDSFSFYASSSPPDTVVGGIESDVVWPMVNGFAFSAYYASKEMGYVMLGLPRIYPQYILGTRVSTYLYFNLGNSMVTSRFFVEDRFDLNSQRVQHSELPKGFLDIESKAIEEGEKMLKDMNSNQQIKP